MFGIIKTQEDPVIGEVLVLNKNISGWYGIYPPHADVSPGASHSWKEFRGSDRDIDSDHDGFVSILGKFFKREDVLFYKQEAFKDFKSKIDKKYKRKD